jgi:hypothetical protein
MDMSAAIAQGNPGEAINGLWSPLYPIIVAAFTRFVLPDTSLEFVMVRLVNFLIFLLTMAAWDALVEQILRRFDSVPARAYGMPRPIPRQHMALLLWAPFLWACFTLNLVCRIGPDTSVTAVVFASLALILALGEGRTSRFMFVLFGAVLGVGYWAKAILFPLGFVVLAAALLEKEVWRVRRRLLLSLLTFLVVAAPLVVALSMKYGRFTYGLSGELNYAWHVDGVPHWLHWQGGPSGHGHPIHASQQIFSNPDAYAFPSTMPASYSPWYDPAYWYQGVKVPFEPRKQIHAVLHNSRQLLTTLTTAAFIVPLVFAAISIFYCWSFQSLLCCLRQCAPICAVAISGIGIYLLVHVEARYLSPFLCLIAALLLCTLRVPRTRWWSGAVVAICLTAGIAPAVPRLASASALVVRKRGEVRDERWQIAQAFADDGVPHGTPVACIGESWTSDWHRLAWVRVVAEIPYDNHEHVTGDVDRFWAGPPDVQEEVLRRFRKAGARWVVANYVPAWADTHLWKHIRNSEYYYRHLDGEASRSDSVESTQVALRNASARTIPRQPAR